MPLLLSDQPVTEADRPYVPHGAARELFRCNAPEVLIEGPAGTGKSRGCLEKAHIFCEHYDRLRVLLVRQTRESMTESVLVTFEDKVVPVGHKILDGPMRRIRQSYEYANGSTIVLGGLDKPSRIMSTDYDLIFVFEATEISENSIEMLTTRLRNGRLPYQQLIADCNPDAMSHWLNNRAERKQMVRLLSRHEDNPQLYDFNLHAWTAHGAEYIAKLDQLTGHRKARLRHGKWANAEGAVYPGFDRAIHVIDPFDIPTDWRRARAIDFGYKNPFVCLWAAFDNDGRIIIYRQIYHTNRIVQDHAKQIRQYSEGEKYAYTVADHDAEDRATLDREGIGTLAGKKDVLPGINVVENRLRVQADGKSRLMIFGDCLIERDNSLAEVGRPTSIIGEFDAYIWKKVVEGKPIKDEPDKQFDHAMDAVRYLVMEEDGGANLDFRIIDTAGKPFKPKVEQKDRSKESDDEREARFAKELSDERFWSTANL